MLRPHRGFNMLIVSADKSDSERQVSLQLAPDERDTAKQLRDEGFPDRGPEHPCTSNAQFSSLSL